ncbi:MAG: FAD-binding oxidoreductase [Candidatus Bathyarchaeia archaeon]
MVNWNLQDIQQKLSDEIGANKISTSRYERAVYSHDANSSLTGTMRTIANSVLFEFVPDMVVMARKIEDVQSVLRLSHEKRIPVTVRGGGSFGYGTTVPAKGGIVLDLAYMDQILEIDEKNMFVTVQAGVKCHTLLEHLERKGLTLAPCPTLAPYATIGGWIATSGLGIGSYKYGSIMRQVSRMKILTPSGVLMETLDGNYFGNGYNLSWLYAGSEGTLGIIVEVTLRIKPKPEQLLTVVYGFPSLKEAQTTISGILKLDVAPYFAEFLEENYLRMIRTMGDDVPQVKALLLLVLEGDKISIEKDNRLITEFCAKLVKEKKAFELRQVGNILWEQRYNSARVRKIGPAVISEDVVLPINKLENFVEFCYELGAYYRLDVGIDGHLLAHNSLLLSPYFLVDERRKGNLITSLPLVKDLVDESRRLGGRTWGSGLWNYFYLRYGKGQAAIEIMKRMKRAFDEFDVLNPGKTFRVRTKLGVPGFSIEDTIKFPVTSIIYNTVLWLASWVIKKIRQAISALWWRR